MWFRKKKEEKVEGVTVEKIEGDSGYIIDIEGQKAVAVKLPGTVARQIAGQVGVGAAQGVGVSAGGATDTDQSWLVVTNMQNPTLQEYNRLTLLASQGLSNASGNQVPQSRIVLTGSTQIPFNQESSS